MPQKQRNFRTTYYKTLGVPVVQHVVDVEASYQTLFAESVVNAAQLGKLAREVGVPADAICCDDAESTPALWETWPIIAVSDSRDAL